MITVPVAYLPPAPQGSMSVVVVVGAAVVVVVVVVEVVALGLDLVPSFRGVRTLPFSNPVDSET